MWIVSPDDVTLFETFPRFSKVFLKYEKKKLVFGFPWLQQKKM